jgi:hypothetical protein
MSEANQPTTETAAKRIGALWDEAVEELPPENISPAEKQLGFHRNFRIDLLKALRAGAEAFHTASNAGHVNPHDPIGIGIVGFQAIMAARAIMASICEAISPINYVTAVTLSRSDKGLRPEELKKQVEDFLTDPKSTHYAWHFGMTEEFAKLASESMKDPKWFDRALASLRENGFVQGAGEILTFKSRNFSIGW